MSGFLVIFLKKIIYLNLNLVIVAALASLILRAGRVKNPQAHYVLWSFVVIRFFLDLVLYSPSPSVGPLELPAHGVLTIGLNASPLPADLFKTFVTSLWLSDIKYSLGDIITILLGPPLTVFLGFLLFVLGVFTGIKRIGDYFTFLRTIKVHSVPIERNFSENNCRRDRTGRAGLKPADSIKCEILSCDYVDTPMVLGLIKPVIVLPTSYVRLLSPEELSAVISHETAHIKRKDHLIFALLSLMQALFVAVPPFARAVDRLSDAEEYFCDRKAVAEGGKKSSIARALLKLVEFQSAMDVKRNTLRTAFSFPELNSGKAVIEKRLYNIFESENEAPTLLAGRFLLRTSFYIVAFALIFGSSVL